MKRQCYSKRTFGIRTCGLWLLNRFVDEKKAFGSAVAVIGDFSFCTVTDLLLIRTGTVNLRLAAASSCGSRCDFYTCFLEYRIILCVLSSK